MKQPVEMLSTAVNQSETFESKSFLSSYTRDSLDTAVDQLTHFKTAQPLIDALKIQGATQLIPLLNKADKKTLSAFTLLNNNKPLQPLIQLFLMETDDQLESVNREELIELLVQPGFNELLMSELESLEERFNKLLSYQLAQIALDSAHNETEQLTRLRNLLINFPSPLNRMVLNALFQLYQDTLTKELFSAQSQSFILFFSTVLKTMDLLTQKTWLETLDKNRLLLLAEHCLSNCISDKKELQECSNHLLTVLFTHQGLIDSNFSTELRSLALSKADYLFDSPSLATLAKEVAPDINLPTQAMASLERLLTTPSFIAQCSAKILKNLCDRYLLVSLLFEPKNASLLRSSTSQQVLVSSESVSTQQWTAKNNNLSKYKITINLQCLIADLIKQSEKLRETDANSAEKALDTVYSMYLNTKEHLRADLLFAAVGQTYRLGAKVGYEVPSGPSWLKKYLPQQYLIDFSSHASALLLATVPQNELMKSAQAVNLLVNDVLLKNSLSTLYNSQDNEIDYTKRQWLELQLTLAAQNMQHEFSSELIDALVKHHSNSSLFFLLAQVRDQGNAFHLFHTILDHHEKREVFLSGLHESDFQQFLKHNNPVVCLADYLAYGYNKPWFAAGLVKFSFYANKTLHNHLLSDALALLTQRVEIDPTQKPAFEGILDSLLSSEEVAKVVLNDFIKDNNQTVVHEETNSEVIQICHYFKKRQVVQAIQNLNNTKTFWEDQAQYRLLLHTFHQNHASLFDPKQHWQTSELSALNDFTSRHLRKKRPFDPQFTIGHTLMGELLFRSANAGQTSLFYYKKKLNVEVSKLSLARNFLMQLIDKFGVPARVKEFFSDETARIKAVFDEHTPLHKDLKNHPVLNDWQILLKQSKVNSGKLLDLSVFLLNYAGPKQNLSLLIRDFFHQFYYNTEYTHPIVNLLKQFPDRDVSAVLFDTLELILRKNPQVLDSTILRLMAHYYVKKCNNKEPKTPDAELDLLIYFGQGKHYALVKAGAELLSKTCKDSDLIKRLTKASVEAEVELSLQTKLGGFFFGLIKALKRLWYYGFNAESNASKIVAFCDDMTPAPTRKLADDRIKSNSLTDSEKSTVLEFKEKRRQLINLLSEIKQSSTKSTTPTQTTNSTVKTLFINERCTVTSNNNTQSTNLGETECAL